MEKVREKFSPESYEALDIGGYRTRFPNETAGLSDEALFVIVMGTDDDLDDDGWRALLTA